MNNESKYCIVCDKRLNTKFISDCQYYQGFVCGKCLINLNVCNIKCIYKRFPLHDKAFIKFLEEAPFDTPLSICDSNLKFIKIVDKVIRDRVNTRKQCYRCVLNRKVRCTCPLHKSCGTEYYYKLL